MKNGYKFLGIICLFGLYACNGGKQQGYNPPEPPSTMHRTMKDATEADSLDNSVKLSIMVQKENTDLPKEAILQLENRLLNICSQNGISCYGGDPAFVLATLVSPMSRDVTTTPPVKHTISFTINYYVANIVSGDVYGSYLTEVMGVGKSPQQAAVNAMMSIRDSQELNNMLLESTSKIISWYIQHSHDFISTVDTYIVGEQYDKAFALLSSVPQEATECFEYAKQKKATVYELYKKQMAQTNYQLMQDEIAKADGTYNPSVGAYLQMIPQSSPLYTQAVAIYENYQQTVLLRGETERNHEWQMEQEVAEAHKLEMEAQMKANEALVAQYSTQNGKFSSSSGSSIVEKIINQAVRLGVSEIIGFIF